MGENNTGHSFASALTDLLKKHCVNGSQEFCDAVDKFKQELNKNPRKETLMTKISQYDEINRILSTAIQTGEFMRFLILRRSKQETTEIQTCKLLNKTNVIYNSIKFHRVFHSWQPAQERKPKAPRRQAYDQRRTRKIIIKTKKTIRKNEDEPIPTKSSPEQPKVCLESTFIEGESPILEDNPSWFFEPDWFLL